MSEVLDFSEIESTLSDIAEAPRCEIHLRGAESEDTDLVYHVTARDFVRILPWIEYQASLPLEDDETALTVQVLNPSAGLLLEKDQTFTVDPNAYMVLLSHLSAQSAQETLATK